MNWIIVPFINNWNTTKQAVESMLAQSIPTRVLLIDNGAPAMDYFRAKEYVATVKEHRVLLLAHHPPLPSLGATWNMALNMVWDTGDTFAMVCNNDVLLRPDTYEHLINAMDGCSVEDGFNEPFFISAVGRREDTWVEDKAKPITWESLVDQPKGGPDFSCYVITKQMHDLYNFDENFVPAYCEDLDMHRRIMLGGHGASIFSVNLPYLHYASGSLKSMRKDKKEELERAIEVGSRTYYKAKWGGPVNEEKYIYPFNNKPTKPGVCTKTSDLFNHGCWRFLGDHEQMDPFLPGADDSSLDEGHGYPADE